MVMIVIFEEDGKDKFGNHSSFRFSRSSTALLGPPNQLLRLPEHIQKHLLRQFAGQRVLQ